MTVAPSGPYPKGVILLIPLDPETYGHTLILKKIIVTTIVQARKRNIPPLFCK